MASLRYADTSDTDQAGRVLLDLQINEQTDVRRRWTLHVLDGRSYRLQVRWLPGSRMWLLDVLDVEGVALLTGIPIRVGQSLLRPHVGERLPGRGFGQIIAIDTSQRGADPGRDDFNTRVRLVYVPAVST
jgi:hypothetical protein